VTSALEVFLNDMRYINSRFTYLLTYFIVVGSGTVDFNEFLRMMSRSQYHMNRMQGRASEHGRNADELEEMRQAFRVFDIDGNGVIDENELKVTMFNLGEDLSDAEVKQMIKLADRNGDGQIDYEGIAEDNFVSVFLDFFEQTFLKPRVSLLGACMLTCKRYNFRHFNADIAL